MIGLKVTMIFFGFGELCQVAEFNRGGSATSFSMVLVGWLFGLLVGWRVGWMIMHLDGLIFDMS